MTPEEIQLPELAIVVFTQGPAATNAYLVADPSSSTAVVIDPAWDGAEIRRAADQRGWRIAQIWLTHAHFDHFGGAGAISDAPGAPIPVALHPDDHSLWRLGGGASAFGISGFDPGPEPTIYLEHGMRLALGEARFEVRHTPGHSRGHVIYLNQSSGLVFCGDLIFRGSVGRTDLPGGSMEVLLQSIQQEVLSLPDETRLYPGHGPATTVGTERRDNPFLVGL